MWDSSPFGLRMTTLLTVMVLLGAGCNPITSVSVAPTGDASAALSNQWVAVSPDLSRMEYTYGESASERLVLFRFTKDAHALRIVHDETDPKAVSQWHGANPEADIVVNGFYFHEDWYPSGQMIVDTERVGERSFDLDRSAYVVLAPVFDIFDASIETLPTDVTSAAQSYPFLIENNEAAVSEDSGLTARRTFIGDDANGFGYIGVLPFDEISLYKLARVLDGMDVAWDDIVNLDGGPSTGLSADTETISESYDSFTVVPSAIIVIKK